MARAARTVVRQDLPGVPAMPENPKVRKVVDTISMLADKVDSNLNSVEEKWVWKKIEAAVDSGAVDHVIDPDDVPGINMIETDASRAGRAWTGPSGEEIPKLGAIKLPWTIGDGQNRILNFQAGKVGRPLISASRLEDAGIDTRIGRR